MLLSIIDSNVYQYYYNPTKRQFEVVYPIEKGDDRVLFVTIGNTNTKFCQNYLVGCQFCYRYLVGCQGFFFETNKVRMPITIMNYKNQDDQSMTYT